MDEDDLIQECKSLNSRLAALYVGARPRRERTPPDAGAAAAARWRRRSERPACGGSVRVAVRGHRQRSRVLVAMAAEHRGAASRLEIGRCEAWLQASAPAAGFARAEGTGAWGGRVARKRMRVSAQAAARPPTRVARGTRATRWRRQRTRTRPSSPCAIKKSKRGKKKKNSEKNARARAHPGGRVRAPQRQPGSPRYCDDRRWARGTRAGHATPARLRFRPSRGTGPPPLARVA